jgi:hypothetical protein
VAEAKNSIIVESLNPGKRSAGLLNNKNRSLDDIAVFTESGEKPLKEVLWRMKELQAEGKSFDAKAPGNELKKYFDEILPDYDKDRVYTSDIKKIVQWFNLLVEKDLLKDEEPTSEVVEEKAE